MNDMNDLYIVLFYLVSMTRHEKIHDKTKCIQQRTPVHDRQSANNKQQQGDASATLANREER